MGQRDREHLSVPFHPAVERFQNPQGGGKQGRYVPKNRAVHIDGLKTQFNQAFSTGLTEDNGAYISFRSFPGFQLALESLDTKNFKKGTIELCAVEFNDAGEQIATVFIPEGAKSAFFKKLEDYSNTLSKRNPKHYRLLDHIQEIRRATIKELWTDDKSLFPADHTLPLWWEVWLQRGDGMAALRFKSFAKNNGIHVKDSFLGFETRTVLLVCASVDQLSRVTESIDDLAELRKAHEVSTAITSLDGLDQRDLVDGLLERLIPPNAESPAVCVLDTGISPNHPLLKPAILNGDVHVVDPNWKLEPKHSHGTEMAGLALYGDVQQCLLDSQSVTLFHRLESVKILPDTNSNEPELYGEITAQAVLRPEVAAGLRNRAFLLAVTAPAGVKEQEKLGLPSSWSAAIDALAFGRDIRVLNDQLTVLDDELNRHPRLFVISSGNIQPSTIVSTDNFLDRCDLSPVEDPAQAWNAITVGAYSAVDTMEGEPSSFDGYSPMAERGELSPVSRTSVAFNQKRWPFKPEVVADGGNLAVSPEGASVDTPENLALVTTRRVTSGGGLLTTTRDTSAATAQVAAIAADVMAAYPKLKMETVRALVVHSAEWTPTMLKRFNAVAKKRDRVNLLRRYGMGVPDRSRAIQSAANALNLLVEGTIRPFEKGTNGIRTGNMHLHTLPWPEEELLSLPPDAPVRMRVTLSYFVDPNPSRRGWTGRYRYGSYGLRFASVYPEETEEQFRKRINKLAREDNETIDSSRDDGWFFGASQQRKPGSLHTDTWEGVGADLARKGLIAVYPVEGWRKHYPQTNLVTFAVGYSLVVSIESPGVDVDLWTPVQQQIAAEVETEIDTPI